MNMLGCNIRESRSGQEAGLRLKGRLLIMMSNRYGDTHMRRHFLRWWVMVNKTFMRNCITKIALTSRLSHESAFWRFRALVQKNMSVKLPEATKRARVMTACMLLELLSVRK
jgi:hypothetical protein